MKDTASGAAWVTPSRAGLEPWPLQSAPPGPSAELCALEGSPQCLAQVRGSGQLDTGPRLPPSVAAFLGAPPSRAGSRGDLPIVAPSGGAGPPACCANQVPVGWFAQPAPTARLFRLLWAMRASDHVPQEWVPPVSPIVLQLLLSGGQIPLGVGEGGLRGGPTSGRVVLSASV